jgi:hypothetical protein
MSTQMYSDTTKKLGNPDKANKTKAKDAFVQAVSSYSSLYPF